MEEEQQLPPEFQRHVQRLNSECGRGNEMLRRFFESGEPNDLEALVSWLSSQFLKPMLYGIEIETSRSRLENCLGRLQEQASRFQEMTLQVTDANQRKFVERWNHEVEAGASLVGERLRKIEGASQYDGGC